MTSLTCWKNVDYIIVYLTFSIMYFAVYMFVNILKINGLNFKMEIGAAPTLNSTDVYPLYPH